MFSRNRTPKPEPPRRAARDGAGQAAHHSLVRPPQPARPRCLAPAVHLHGHLRALVASGAASAEIAGQGGRRALVGRVADGKLIAGPAGAVVLGARGKKRKTTVAIRDAQGGLKLTEVKGAERAHQFVELFSHLAAQARQAAS